MKISYRAPDQLDPSKRSYVHKKIIGRLLESRDAEISKLKERSNPADIAIGIENIQLAFKIKVLKEEAKWHWITIAIISLTSVVGWIL